MDDVKNEFVFVKFCARVKSQEKLVFPFIWNLLNKKREDFSVLHLNSILSRLRRMKS